MAITTAGLIIIPAIVMVALGATVSLDNPTVEENITTIQCPDPNYTDKIYNRVSAANSTNTLSCTNVATVEGWDYEAGSPVFSQAGYVLFLADDLSRQIEKMSATSDTISEIAAPSNFTVIGQPVDTANLSLIFLMLSLCMVTGIVLAVRGVG